MNPEIQAVLDGTSRWCVVQGDCLDVMRQLPDGCVDAVVTDPPYGIEADKAGAHSSIRDEGKWDRMGWDDARPPKQAFDLVLSVAKSTAIWGGNYFADLLPPSSGWLVWVKPEAGTGFSLADCEMCWTSYSNAARVGFFPRRDGNAHPTQKPVALMTWCIERLNLPDDSLIIDPYCGSGTTGVAAVQLGHRFIGIEREASYCDIARRRIADAAAQGNLFANV